MMSALSVLSALPDPCKKSVVPDRGNLGHVHDLSRRTVLRLDHQRLLRGPQVVLARHHDVRELLRIHRLSQRIGEHDTCVNPARIVTTTVVNLQGSFAVSFPYLLPQSHEVDG